MQFHLVLFFVSLVVFADSYAEPRGLLPEDFYQEVTIEGTALSPDGTMLAFTAMTIDEEKNKRHRTIWMQELKNGSPVGEPYAFSSPIHNATSPGWSPDGRLLHFQSKRGEDDNAFWFVRTDGRGGEAFHIEGVEGYPVWSRDGEWIAFVKEPEDDELKAESDSDPKAPESEDDEDEPAKKKERDGWIAPDAITSTLNEKRFDGRVYTTMRVKRDATLTLLPHVSTRNKRQIYVVEGEGGEATRITDLDFDAGRPVWTDDGSALIFSADPLQDDEYNEDYTSQLFSVSRVGGEPIALTSNPGNDFAPRISPNGKRLAYLHADERGSQTDLLVVEIDANGTFQDDPVNITEDWDYGPGAPNWAGSNASLIWTSTYHGNAQVFRATLRGKVEAVTQGNHAIRGLSTDESGNVRAYALTNPTHVSDVYVAKRGGKKPTRITKFNDEWMQDIRVAPAERITWTVDDGTEIEGWVIKPLDYTPGKKYPMILKIHGGPHSSYGNYWFRTFHVLSNAGFFVFYPNPRGSAGYGHDFTYATRGQWGELDAEDYLKGVDAVCAKYPGVDAKRVGVSGGSYGGYMTAWLTSTTDRFAAANPSRMIANWESWYGTSDVPQLTEWEFFGEPWEKREIYRRLSPISYVEHVTAPTLIIHSENDYRTPIGDGEQWYIALKKRGIPVEMVRYPRSSHGLSRTGEPWLLVDRLERIKSWFTYWLIKEQVTAP